MSSRSGASRAGALKRACRSMLLIALAMPLCIASANAATATSGTSGAQFLKLGSGARAGAMADSFSAVADDVHAAYYNPAGLSQLKATQLGGAHTAYFQGINYEVLDFAYPWGRQEHYSRHTLALGVYHLSVGDIERRASDTTDSIGSFGASDGAYAVSYAYAFDRKLSLGGTGKYILQTLDTYKASAFAADFGALYKLNPEAVRPMTAAAVVRNLGSRPSFAGGVSDPLPMSITGGLGYEAVANTLKLNLEATKYRDTSLFASFGGEYVRHFSAASGALRFGYSSHYRDNGGLNGLTFGAGMAFQKVGFDFAWVPFGNLGDTFRYSLLVKF